MTYDEAVAWLRQNESERHYSPAFAHAKGLERVLAVLEREHEDAEKWRTLEEDHSYTDLLEGVRGSVHYTLRRWYYDADPQYTTFASAIDAARGKK